MRVLSKIPKHWSKAGCRLERLRLGKVCILVEGIVRPPYYVEELELFSEGIEPRGKEPPPFARQKWVNCGNPGQNMGWREWGEGHRRLVTENVILRSLCLLRLDTIRLCDLMHCDPELHNIQTHRVNV